VGASIAPADQAGVGSDVLLRAALAMPLLYVVPRAVHALTSTSVVGGQAFGYYLVSGILAGIPVAVWGLALLLLVLGTGNRLAWAVVCIGGVAVSAYGLLALLDVPRQLNDVLAFGLYVTLVSLWRIVLKRRSDVRFDAEQV
jgi:hypothetical protein